MTSIAASQKADSALTLRVGKLTLPQTALDRMPLLASYLRERCRVLRKQSFNGLVVLWLEGKDFDECGEDVPEYSIFVDFKKKDMLSFKRKVLN